MPSFKYSYSHLAKVRCGRGAEALYFKQTSNQNSIISFLPHRLLHEILRKVQSQHTRTQQYGTRNTRNPYTMWPFKNDVTAKMTISTPPSLVTSFLNI